jgi:hypothetical protein
MPGVVVVTLVFIIVVVAAHGPIKRLVVAGVAAGSCLAAFTLAFTRVLVSLALQLALAPLQGALPELALPLSVASMFCRTVAVVFPPAPTSQLARRLRKARGKVGAGLRRCSVRQAVVPVIASTDWLDTRGVVDGHLQVSLHRLVVFQDGQVDKDGVYLFPWYQAAGGGSLSM